jgi:hypothetical protein
LAQASRFTGRGRRRLRHARPPAERSDGILGRARCGRSDDSSAPSAADRTGSGSPARALGPSGGTASPGSGAVRPPRPGFRSRASPESHHQCPGTPPARLPTVQTVRIRIRPSVLMPGSVTTSHVRVGRARGIGAARPPAEPTDGLLAGESGANGGTAGRLGETGSSGGAVRPAWRTRPRARRGVRPAWRTRPRARRGVRPAWRTRPRPLRSRAAGSG